MAISRRTKTNFLISMNNFEELKRLQAEKKLLLEKSLIEFYTNQKDKWGQKQMEVSDALVSFLKSGKNFEVELSEIKDSKSYKQIRGIHKLCELLATRLSESNGIKYSLENAKDWVKWNFDYTQLATEEEAIAEALNEKSKAEQQGDKMTREQFINLVNAFKAGLKRTKSFADATKEEMMDLIEKIHYLAERMKWNEVRLNAEDMQSLVEAFKVKH